MILKITQAAREAAAECCPKELHELCGCYGSGVSGYSGFPCSDCGGSGGLPPDWLVQALQRAMNQAADEALERAAALVAKLDECKPYIDSAFFQMANHGMPHTGPQYGEELEALRAALSTLSPSPAVDLLREARCPLCQTAAPEAFVNQCNRPECPYRSNTK